MNKQQNPRKLKQLHFEQEHEIQFIIRTLDPQVQNAQK